MLVSSWDFTLRWRMKASLETNMCDVTVAPDPAAVQSTPGADKCAEVAFTASTAPINTGFDKAYR